METEWNNIDFLGEKWDTIMVVQRLLACLPCHLLEKWRTSTRTHPPASPRTSSLIFRNMEWFVFHFSTITSRTCLFTTPPDRRKRAWAKKNDYKWLCNIYLIDTNLQLNYVLKVGVFLDARSPKKTRYLIITSNSHRRRHHHHQASNQERRVRSNNHLEANARRVISTKAIRIGIYSRSFKAF